MESRDGCQNDEQSRDAHLSAETRDGDLNAEALADYSAEKSHDVRVGCCGAHVLATANVRVPWARCGCDHVDDRASSSAMADLAEEAVQVESAVVPDASETNSKRRTAS